MLIVNNALDEMIESALATLPDAPLLDQLVHVFGLRYGSGCATSISRATLSAKPTLL